MPLPYPHSHRQTEAFRFALLFVLILVPFQLYAQQDLTRYVDPFIGTGGHGHTFPGATVPFGMVQVSPDTRLSGWDGCSGYHYSDHIIYGFSHTHLSGTGISDYGDILLMPTVGVPRLNAGGELPLESYSSSFSHKAESASPGYYSVRLDRGNILAEVTASARAGFHRYTFPATENANIVLDLVHRDKVIDSELELLGDRTVVGWRRSSAWARDQIVYFAAEFSQPITSYRIVADSHLSNLTQAEGQNLKAFFTFDARSGRPVLVRVGISAVSVAGARSNLAAEINHWDFDKIRSNASRIWNEQLNKVVVSGGTEAQLKNFYTALYHSMIAPNLFMDADGRYRGRDFKVHTANGFTNYTVFSLWDTFRAAHPLYTIIDQKRTVDFIRTFLAQYEQGGRLPVWELAGNETDTMIGYHSVSVIADATTKGIRGFDLSTAFEAMKHSAELKHFGLAAYTDHGYIGLEEEKESVSKTLEYAYDDWCIAQMARLLGRTEDYNRYLRRAQSYKNLFDPETGFMRPRSNGNWLTPFEPREVNSSFTEANSWQYSFFVPQDISGLIALMGGKNSFAAKLDQLFTAESATTGRDQADITGLIGQYAHGNEPSHHMAYLYAYAGQPWKTESRVREIMDHFYRPEPDGLIGNEDCGQMSAWYVLSAVGFYPVTPGAPVYILGTPLFPEARFNLENGRKFIIRARAVSDRNIYIQSARLNGKRYDKSYLSHAQLMAGGEMVFEMGPRPNRHWGVGLGREPVSRIIGPQIVPVPVIKAAGKTFKDRLEVAIQDLNKTLSIHYTTDGSEPGSESGRYTEPFVIDQSRTVKAVAIDRSGSKSFVVTADFHRIPHNWTISLESRYSAQYTGGGDFALIDGIRGTSNWTSGAWQGYHGRDLLAVIDLGEIQTVARIRAGFLQDVGSWIWMPRRVEIETSMDGREFTSAGSISNDVPDGRDGTGLGVVIKDFVKELTPGKARYIRLRAVNYGKIPAWHPGSGSDSWIFADEIIVE